MKAVCLSVLCLLGLACLANAKIVSVSGQVTWMGPGGTVPLPVNTWSYNPGTAFGSGASLFHSPTLDVPSPSINGVLGCGTFDEQQGVVLTAAEAASFTLSDGSHLTAGVAYDAIYYYCHQEYALSTGSYSASGTVTTDNKFVGCTSSNNADLSGVNELKSDEFFALSGIYYQNETQGSRGFESGDTGVPFGTTSVFNNGWSEPGDYTRCFSHTCSNCQCTTTAALKNAAFCLDSSSPTQVVKISDLTTTFSSTCDTVDASSFFAKFVGTGASANGQQITVPTNRPTSVLVQLTAGCGCFNEVIIQLNPCGQTTGPCGNCATASSVAVDCAQTTVTTATGSCISLEFSSTSTNC